ncbi:DUF11 domain-containing protein [Dolichospermum sp. UHCC 0259]|nr:DUF11 domain-containing protein [Dolichospermum sp. UHCC 0259]
MYWLIKNYLTSQGGCCKKLTASILLGSILQATTPVIVRGQETGNVRRFDLVNQAAYTYSYTDPDAKSNSIITIQGSSVPIQANNELVDPLGRIFGCGGTLLDDYTGFSVGVYEPLGATGTELGQLVSLTTTEVPDVPNNNVPAGLEPNSQNTNPYFIVNSPANFKGVYNFLLDANKGQIDVGKTYIFVVNPPANSIFQEQRIKLEILSNTNNIVRYRATSLNGQPISVTDNSTTITSEEVLVNNAATQSLSLLALNFQAKLCQPNQLRITKTGDRATAEPGDTAIYRVSVKNTSEAATKNVSVTDTLPIGFNFLPNSVRGEIDGQSVAITTVRNGNTVTFTIPTNLNSNQTVNIAYAVQLTNDAQRGTGRNSAIATSQRIDNNLTVTDGPATHYLKVRPGITSSCGIIIGRVFVDKNFDGEQQRGEPGIPNAVIYLENGNRIITDPNGLFSLANVLPGAHTGVLDLSSLPGYTLAPNRKFNERNSQSRLVRVEPGGMVRMNFAVTPTFQEEETK